MSAVRVNKHGVVTAGFETHRITFPKATRAYAELRVARVGHDWVYGFELRLRDGCTSAAPSIGQHRERFKKRELAIRAGWGLLKKWALADTKSPRSEEMRKTAAMVAAAIERRLEGEEAMITRVAKQPRPQAERRLVKVVELPVDSPKRGPKNRVADLVSPSSRDVDNSDVLNAPLDEKIEAAERALALAIKLLARDVFNGAIQEPKQVKAWLAECEKCERINWRSKSWDKALTLLEEHREAGLSWGERYFHLAPVRDLEESARREKAREAKAASTNGKHQTNAHKPAAAAKDSPSNATDGKAAVDREPEDADLMLVQLIRHPKNRVPKPAAVAKMAASLIKEGQLERVVVRSFPDCGTYQIISGETRWLAAFQNKWPTLKCKILHGLSDARALELLATYNAEREDLDPIEKAEMIRELCKPEGEGGSGYTREKAAKLYKLESGSAASNLVRLLELPAWCLDLVRDGTLTQRHARELLPFVHHPSLLDSIKPATKKPGTVDAFVREVQDIVRHHARPLGGGFQDGQNYRQVHFKPTDKQRGELDIVKLKGRYHWEKKPEEWCLNVERWEELQKPGEEKARKRREAEEARWAKQSARRGGMSIKSSKPSVSKKAAAAERARQFAKRLDAWRTDWLRYLVAWDLLHLENPSLTDPACIRLLMWASIDRGRMPTDMGSNASHQRFDRRDKILAKSLETSPSSVWSKLETTSYENEDLAAAAVKFVAGMCFTFEGQNKNQPEYFLPPPIVEGLARQLQIDIKQAWRRELAGPLTQRYFELFTKDELARDWGTSPGLSKAQMVDVIMLAGDTKKSLPSNIKPLARAPRKAKGA